MSEDTPYTLLGADGQPYASSTPGTLGGHRRTKIYGRLDCPSARRAIAAGGYIANRVFFADEQAASRQATGLRRVPARGLRTMESHPMIIRPCRPPEASAQQCNGSGSVRYRAGSGGPE